MLEEGEREDVEEKKKMEAEDERNREEGGERLGGGTAWARPAATSSSSIPMTECAFGNER